MLRLSACWFIWCQRMVSNHLARGFNPLLYHLSYTSMSAASFAECFICPCWRRPCQHSPKCGFVPHPFAFAHKAALSLSYIDYPHLLQSVSAGRRFCPRVPDAGFEPAKQIAVWPRAAIHEGITVPHQSDVKSRLLGPPSAGAGEKEEVEKSSKGRQDAATSRTARRWKNALQHSFTAPSLPRRNWGVAL